MNNFFRALLAGAAAKKFGGGCLGTIIVFVLVWVALGQCGSKFATDKTLQPVSKEKYIKARLIPSTNSPVVNKIAG